MAGEIKTELQALKDRFSELYNRKQFKTLVDELYCADAIIMPPGERDIHGKKETEELIARYNKYEHDAELRFKTLEAVEVGPNYVLEWGTYDFHDLAGKITDGGTFLMLSRKENGQWMIYVNMWNHHEI